MTDASGGETCVVSFQVTPRQGVVDPEGGDRRFPPHHDSAPYQDWREAFVEDVRRLDRDRT